MASLQKNNDNSKIGVTKMSINNNGRCKKLENDLENVKNKCLTTASKVSSKSSIAKQIFG